MTVQPRYAGILAIEMMAAMEMTVTATAAVAATL
jgi:hypothetical protein